MNVLKWISGGARSQPPLAQPTCIVVVVPHLLSFPTALSLSTSSAIAEAISALLEVGTDYSAALSETQRAAIGCIDSHAQLISSIFESLESAIAILASACAKFRDAEQCVGGAKLDVCVALLGAIKNVLETIDMHAHDIRTCVGESEARIAVDFGAVVGDVVTGEHSLRDALFMEIAENAKQVQLYSRDLCTLEVELAAQRDARPLVPHAPKWVKTSTGWTKPDVAGARKAQGNKFGRVATSVGAIGLALTAAQHHQAVLTLADAKRRHAAACAEVRELKSLVGLGNVLREVLGAQRNAVAEWRETCSWLAEFRVISHKLQTRIALSRRVECK
jgi:hypothetical protein